MKKVKVEQHETLIVKDSKVENVEQQKPHDGTDGKQAHVEDHETPDDKDSKPEQVEQHQSPDVTDGKQASKSG